MCEIHRYTTVHSDGSREKTWSSRLCPVGERNRKPCNNTKEFKHPVNERYTGANVTSYYTTPPSPPSSDSSFPLSGNEGEGSRKKRSGIYVNGAKVVDVGRKPSRREKRHSDHIIIVDPPVVPSSPPRHPHITPILKPSSPPKHFASAQYPSHPRPEVRIEVGAGSGGGGHRRQSSHSSQQSRDSNSVSDEERRVRKLKRELEKAEEAVRQQRIHNQISRANEAIASRPAVPSAPNPLASASAPTTTTRPYRRPSVSVRRTDHELTDAMHKLRVSEQTMADAERERKRQAARRADERRQAKEDEAQKQRLRERMTPASQRRPTKIVFPDGTYRYEF